MSYTEVDEAYERFLAGLYEENAEQAIDEFTRERLQSHYTTNPEIAAPSFEMLSRARSILGVDLTASCLFAAISSEVCIRAALLRPLFHGLVHSESVANLLVDLAMLPTGVNRFEKVLARLTSEYGGFALESHKRKGSDRLLWNEIEAVVKTRNKIVHRGEQAIETDTDLAIGVAAELTEFVLPNVLEGLGLHLHGASVCATIHTPW